jgi:SgrR family transcriptional regulator
VNLRTLNGSFFLHIRLCDQIDLKKIEQFTTELSSFMSSFRLEQQYLKLWDKFEGKQQLTNLQSLSEYMFCTKRHMRTLLNSMESAGWVQWESQPGRGKQSKLTFLKSSQSLRQNRAQELLEQDNIDQLLHLVGDKESVKQLILARLGQSFRQGKYLLRVLYYRPMTNLIPWTPLRRSETHIVRQIFNGLVKINEDSGEVEPDIAHHWQEISQNQWRFWIRPGIRFHHDRDLEMEDIVYSISGFFERNAFLKFDRIECPAPLVIDIFTEEYNKWLPHLLSTNGSMILPREWQSLENFESYPKGTGAYSVERNSKNQLKIKAFDSYFGYRALLDEVSVWVLDDLAKNIDVKIKMSTEENNLTEVETRLEDGCYYLLFDKRSKIGRNSIVKQWIAKVLNPLAILTKSQRYCQERWSPANNIIPSWYYADGFDDVEKPEQLSSVKITHFSNHPEHIILINCIKDILKEYKVRLDVQEVDYNQWFEGNLDSDIWMGSANFSPPLEFSFIFYFLDIPLFHNCLENNIYDLIPKWKSGVLHPQEVSNDFLRTNSLLPLVHNRLIIEGNRCVRGMKMNALGWFDFKSAWYAPNI